MALYTGYIVTSTHYEVQLARNNGSDTAVFALAPVVGTSSPTSDNVFTLANQRFGRQQLFQYNATTAKFRGRIDSA